MIFLFLVPQTYQNKTTVLSQCKIVEVKQRKVSTEPYDSVRRDLFHYVLQTALFYLLVYFDIINQLNLTSLTISIVHMIRMKTYKFNTSVV